MSSSAFGNQWYRDGIAIEGASASTYQATVAGNYTVNVKVDDCVSVMSDTRPVITGDLQVANNDGILAFPNPVRNTLTIHLDGFKGAPVDVSIFDHIGKVTDRLSTKGGSTEFLDVSSYAAGSYILQAAQGKTKKKMRFVKE